MLGSKGLLSSKTRILATNSIPVLIESDFTAMIKDGEIIEQGTFRQLMAMKGMVADLIKTAGQESGSSSKAPSPGGSGSDTSTIIEAGSSQEKDELEEAQEGVAALQTIRPGPKSSDPKTAQQPRTGSVTTLRRASAASFRGPRGKLHDEETPSKTKQAKEHQEQGKVKWKVYTEYARNNNLAAVGIYVVTLLAAQTAQIGG